MTPALETVFVDRDGTLNVSPPEGAYVASADEAVLLPGAADAIRRLNRAGARVLVVSNQRGISRGLMTEDDLLAVQQRLVELLAGGGARVDGWYHCPHAEGSCDCRKPDVGLFHRARSEHPGLRFETAAVVGDSWRDIAAGSRLGMRTVLVTADGAAALPDGLSPDHVARSLDEATRWLLRDG